MSYFREYCASEQRESLVKLLQHAAPCPVLLLVECVDPLSRPLTNMRQVFKETDTLVLDNDVVNLTIRPAVRGIHIEVWKGFGVKSSATRYIRSRIRRA